MKKNLLILLIFQISYSQSNLNLPISDYEINFKSLTPISNIYVYKNGDVYLEKEKTRISDLGMTLFETKNEFPIQNQRFIQVHLLADKSTDFEIIDSIKTQISSARLHLYYRTNHMEDVTKGINWRNHSSLEYFEIKEKESESSSESDLIEIVAIKNPIQLQINEELYNLNLNKAKELINKIKYANIRFINKNKIKINNTKVKLNDSREIFDIISNYDILFIRFKNKMTYNDYITLITSIKDVYKILRKESKEIPIFEISFELENELKKNDFKL
ncbi:hypothetical protein BWZ22_13140 [Seonamhaeicola sp. S2-3]|uniref:hypothetical protein n=1 Tax=Seonamhaeicola sp. S2-3 TaxID=1936081 RepID=UPI000972C665|nr:hypothetical protein [Seonamhaeicola sp. S2-3]APY12116.1 hypothetical protein BWZ22_13140 [Seonamhaeicola sp. S2-3]